MIKLGSRCCRKMTQNYFFSHLGRKHEQKIAYTEQICKQFNLLASNAQSSSPAQLRMKSRSVNRLFVCCLFSKIIGNNFPLSIYLSQSINYKKDIEIDQPVIGQVQVVKDMGKNRFEIQTICKNLQGEILVQGTAVILQE